MFVQAARALLEQGGPVKGGLAQLALAACEVAPAERAGLVRAAAREAADSALAERESAAILETLAPLRPAVLKGVALAERWPDPRARPAGDLDLLLEAEALPRAVAALCDRGFRVAVQERAGGRLRPAPTGVELIAPEGSFVNADLHSRPFRSVGGRLDGGELLARARPATLLGQPVRRLDPADELLYLLVHAAKHGACAPKWLLDLWVVAQPFDDWERLVERARRAGVTRPAWAAAQLVARLPGVRIPPAVLSALRPPPPARLFIRSLVTVGEASPRWQRYARELLLEESAWRRLRMLGGVAERVLGRID
jgi:Uncharacterised nucleotidyltransferase